MNEKKCPYCGAPLPENASFCPHCAKSINQRTEAKTPRRIPAAAVRASFLALIAVCVTVAALLNFRPKTYVGLGEVFYTDGDGTYQFVLNNSSNPYQAGTEIQQDVGDEEQYRFPLRLHITHKDTGADAGGTFLQKVTSVEAHVIQTSDVIVEDVAESMMAENAGETNGKAAEMNGSAADASSPADSASSDASEKPDNSASKSGDTSQAESAAKRDYEIYPVQASAPEPKDFAPDAALVSLIDFNRYSPVDTQIVMTLHMENSDTIQINTNMHLTPIMTYDYSAETDDLSDTAALQALIDRLADEIDSRDIVNITLPAIAYSEPLILHDRAFNLMGTEENSKRTTFTAGIQMRSNKRWINYIKNIDFTGTKNAIGVSTAGRTWIQECSFTGWKTAVLAFGDTWVNTTDCSFTDNGTGLYFNASGISVNDTRFTGNQFKDNDTAVRLESVPSDVALDFSDTTFSGNATDIANPANQALEISQAIFQ